jgi:arginyl-tRNA synthetase
MPHASTPKPHVGELFAQALHAFAPDIADPIEIARGKDPAHGDFASNVALKLSKTLRRNPRDVAQALIDNMPGSAWLDRIEAAGPGFINVFLKPAAWQNTVRAVLEQGADFGRARAGSGARVQVEFVSANPTGPLHVGHGRGAAYGASLANVLEAAGHAVTREYYVNDAGRQMDILATATWLRYLDRLGEAVPFPPNGYRGDYVRDMARALHAGQGERFLRTTADVLAGVPERAAGEPSADPEFARQNEAHLDGLIATAKRLLGADYAFIHAYVLEEQLSDCRRDLEAFGVHFDVWFSEKSLFEQGQVARAVAALDAAGFLYEQDGAKWFRATTFGDEKDRVVQRGNGEFTYFASDIAYHREKFQRGFARVIDVWGADHHGYIPRVKAALTALGEDAARLDVALVQFAVLYRGGEKAQMSTRSGEFVTLRELRDEVGNDAARFFYVLRKSEQHLDFDLDLAKSQSNDNPVYYIQYAHARLCSVLAQWREQWGGELAILHDADLSPLAGPHEIALMRRLADYPEIIDDAARELAPHLIAYYLKDLAADLHGWYNAQQFLVEDETVRHARLALVLATRFALASGLALLGVAAPEKM